ncbi:MAG: FAD-linked oxidase C-terminal domain-containing protein [Chloroflexota bacterium]|nr:FAD-linked oxidase C-terminal domain-containing protein [Chloroflexota bacterium]MDP6508023.1 FAD-linked oxidase C-terminal domain-containing protein [Chloroflexota bacterium]MDP6758090.1 FAD-linked oxidase C-terminal domain-containing protein [Chloroflexota bacterium]
MPGLIRALERALTADRVFGDAAGRTAYEFDASLAHGRPRAVVLPESAAEVCRVVGVAREFDLPVVPRGAGTGLSGGAIPSQGGIVVAFTRMDRILDVDRRDRRALVEPGVVNDHLTTAAAKHGLYYAPDPSSQRICTLGGNVAENSGGAHCLAHGTTTNYVLGLEVALAGSELVWLGSDAGDAAGYDLRGAMVGSEGTLGIVTKIALRLRRAPEAVRTLLAAFTGVRAAGEAVTEIIAAGILPVALELVDGMTARAVEEALHAGFPPDAGAVLLVEIEGVEDGLDAEMERIEAICAGSATTTRRAETESERAALWRGRKGARTVLGNLRPDYYVHDAVVPRSRLPDALEAIEVVAAKHQMLVATYLHAGDGNLHPNVLFDAADPAEFERAMQAGSEILHFCLDLGGVLSGEHGIGLEKRGYMDAVLAPADQAAMRSVGAAFDPQDRLNPGKIFADPPGG